MRGRRRYKMEANEGMQKKSMGPGPLAMPLPVWVIGSYGRDGAANLMTAVWCGQCSSNPPCIAVSVRASRLSKANILFRRAFTVNVSSRSYVDETDFFGLVSGRDADKFVSCGLTPVRSLVVDAPYIDEFPLVLECALFQTVELGEHIQLIGKIVDQKVAENLIDSSGRVDMGALAPLYCSPADRCYYALGEKLSPAYSAGLRFRQSGILKKPG